MKSFFNCVLINSALGLLASTLWAQGKPDGGELNDASQVVVSQEPRQIFEDPELEKVVDVLIKAMDNRASEGVFESMTGNGVKEFIGLKLFEAASMSGVKVDTAADESKQLQKLINAYRLGEVQIAFCVPGDTPQEIVENRLKAEAEVRDKLLARIPAKERQKKAVEMLGLLSKLLVSEYAPSVGTVDISGDLAEVGVVLGPNTSYNPPVGQPARAKVARPDVPYEFVVFVKVDGVWKFDRFNSRRAKEMAMVGLGEAEVAPSSKP